MISARVGLTTTLSAGYLLPEALGPTVTMDVSVILCTYNRAPLLRVVLDQLAAQRALPGLEWEVLIVDNNSNDGTAALSGDFVRRFPGRFRYAHEARQGKSWALNAALDMAGGEVLAFTDDDVEIDPNWLFELTRPFSDPECMGAGGRIIPLFNQGQPGWLLGPLSRELRAPLVEFDLGDQPAPLRQAPFGANMAFRREVFRRHPRFRTDLGPKGRNVVKGEDVEFAVHVIAAGEPLVYVPSALVRHPVEPARQRREYFLRWWFEFGRTEMKVEADDVPKDAVTVFGVPAYLVRQACGAALRALVSRDDKQRLGYVLQAARACGSVSAALGRAPGRPI